MRSLFINTSSFFMSIAILENGKVVYKKEEEMLTDMASRIVPEIELAFDNVTFDVSDINNIFVVNGPGSFTGVRVGVTVAKMIGWTLKKDIIPISSLELLATTKIDETNHIGVIDARRGYVFAGIYDSSLNQILEDKYMPLSELDVYLSDGKLISYDNFDGAIKPIIDIEAIVAKHINDKPINAHALKPNYLKLTEAEEKKKGV